MLKNLLDALVWAGFSGGFSGSSQQGVKHVGVSLDVCNASRINTDWKSQREGGKECFFFFFLRNVEYKLYLRDMEDIFPNIFIGYKNWNIFQILCLFKYYNICLMFYTALNSLQSLYSCTQLCSLTCDHLK